MRKFRDVLRAQDADEAPVMKHGYCTGLTVSRAPDHAFEHVVRVGLYIALHGIAHAGLGAAFPDRLENVLTRENPQHLVSTDDRKFLLQGRQEIL